MSAPQQVAMKKRPQRGRNTLMSSRIDPELKARMAQAARDQGVTLSLYMETLVREHLDHVAPPPKDKDLTNAA